MNVRAAEEAEINHLAKVRHEGWQDAHAQILPAELTRLRTLESFRDRLQAALPNVRVLGPFGAPVGFCILKENELYQLYVSAQARGSGVAAALMADAEGRLAEDGWRARSETTEPRGSMTSLDGGVPGRWSTRLRLRNGTMPLEVWRYEKDLRAVARLKEADAEA